MVALSCIAVFLSLVANSRVWFHSSGRLHIWYHVGLFALLGLLTMCISRRSSTRLVWLAVFILLGGCMEFGEAVRFHGSMEWNDVLSDTVGVVLGALAGLLISSDAEIRP